MSECVIPHLHSDGGNTSDDIITMGLVCALITGVVVRFSVTGAGGRSCGVFLIVAVACFCFFRFVH